jgi:hypothetical protein
MPKVMPALLSYIRGPKGKALHISIESFIMGEPPYFQPFFVMGQSKYLIATKKKKKTWTSERPPIL